MNRRLIPGVVVADALLISRCVMASVVLVITGSKIDDEVLRRILR